MLPAPLVSRGRVRPRRGVAGPTPAEDMTRGVLRAVRRRGKVLGWVPRLPTGSGPVFDLVLTAAGPLALQSVRWQGVLDPTQLPLVAAEARDAGREAESVLGAAGSFHAVLPVVAVWGGDAYAVPSGGCLLHDVLFLRGRELRHWLRCELSRGDRVPLTEAEDLLVRLALLPG